MKMVWQEKMAIDMVGSGGQAEGERINGWKAEMTRIVRRHQLFH